MKILEPAKGKEATCRKCSTKVLLEKGDVWESRGKDISGCMDVDYYWNCPYCKQANSTQHSYLVK